MGSETVSDEGSDLPSFGRDQRSQRLLRCSIVDALGRTHACLLKNISRRGVGGTGCYLLAGQPVTVLLPGLGLLTGSVKWTSHGKFGIRLDQEIDPSAITFVPGTTDRESEAPKFEVKTWHQPSNDGRRPGFRRN